MMRSLAMLVFGLAVVAMATAARADNGLSLSSRAG